MVSYPLHQKTVFRRFASSKTPVLSDIAEVNAPFTCPKSSLALLLFCQTDTYKGVIPILKKIDLSKKQTNIHFNDYKNRYELIGFELEKIANRNSKFFGYKKRFLAILDNDNILNLNIKILGQFAKQTAPIFCFSQSTIIPNEHSEWSISLFHLPKILIKVRNRFNSFVKMI